MPRTRGTWTPEQARALGAKGRATAANRAALKVALLKSAPAPVLALPPVLDKQIVSVTLLLDRAQRKGWSMAAERWSKVLERLVKLRKVTMPSAAKSNGSSGAASHTTPGSATPKPLTPSPEPSPAAARPSSLDDPEPLEQSPID